MKNPTSARAKIPFGRNMYQKGTRREINLLHIWDRGNFSFKSANQEKRGIGILDISFDGW